MAKLAFPGFLLAAVLSSIPSVQPLSLSSSSGFYGARLEPRSQTAREYFSTSRSYLEMRKQKSSDRRTRRLQRGQIAYSEELAKATVGSVTASPMAGQSWSHKKTLSMQNSVQVSGGRGRSRKRSALYNSLSLYHNKFLTLLTEEYKQEEEEVLSRIKASIDEPLGYEAAGFALFDLYPERRGNLYSDEVYRLIKAHDATTTFSETHLLESKDGEVHGGNNTTDRFLPPNSKFSSNDIITLTLQPRGSGDFFSTESLPTKGVAIEGRVLNSGPTYIDVAIPNGSFEAAFGPAPNNSGPSGKGDSKMRLRADQFFSDIPYQRMISALSQLTAIPGRQEAFTASQPKENKGNEDGKKISSHENICMDGLLREVILSSHAFSDPFSMYYGDSAIFDMEYLASSLAKPPMGSSQQLAKKALSYIRSNDQQIFERFNEPQLSAISASLTRRLTMVQGPPGTGKTSVASAIGFGFALQCRSLSASGNAKVLATACSNVGADNLADRLLRLGLKVIRIGRPSAVSEDLWEHTLDAYIDRDPNAQFALDQAARATAALKAISRSNRGKNTKSVNDNISRDLATSAVKASIEACNIAATKALRDTDVIVSTSTGAMDPRLLSACGILVGADEPIGASGRVRNGEGDRSRKKLQNDRMNTAPDGLPPLSCPFVIIDESCQSVEPASLIPIVSTNSCRSLVLLGDPCQLPPTVRSGDIDSPLAVSLMSRLAATLPHPQVAVAGIPNGNKNFNTQYLDALPMKKARSHFHAMSSEKKDQVSYRKRYGGSFLLTVQYRMHPSISALPSAIFYDGLLATPAFLANARQFPKVFGASMPCADKELSVRMVHIGGRNNERQGSFKSYPKAITGSQSIFFGEKQQTSYWNLQEAKVVVALVKEALSSAKNDPTSPKSIGIVTPYMAQVELIKKKLNEDEELVATLQKLSTEVEVKTVDGFQGRERDLVIFSAVRSNRKGSIGFLRDWRRLNVSLTRAKSGLLVVGDKDTLSDGDKHWASFLTWCDAVECIFPSRNQ